MDTTSLVEVLVALGGLILMLFAPAPAIRVELPRPTAVAPSAAPLQIAITKDGKVSVEGRSVDEAKLRAVLQQRVTADADVQVIFAADKATPYGRVVALVDLAKSVGVRRFAITVDSN